LLFVFYTVFLICTTVIKSDMCFHTFLALISTYSQKIINLCLTKKCFVPSYRAIFRLSSEKCYIQLAMLYRVRDLVYILLIYISN
jgi:hypothetical protein